MVFLSKRPLLKSIMILATLFLVEMVLFVAQTRTDHFGYYETGSVTLASISFVFTIVLGLILTQLQREEWTPDQKRLAVVPAIIIVVANMGYLLSQLVTLLVGELSLYTALVYLEKVISLYQLPAWSFLLILSNVGVYWALSSKILPSELPNSVEVDKPFVRTVLLKYNQTPSNYLILEEGIQYFAVAGIEGVIGYTLCCRTAFVVAEPVCPKEDLEDLLKAFKRACQKSGYRICFSKITEDGLESFKKCGFSVQEYGQEALLNADRFTLKGTAVAKIRWGINKTTKLGYQVREYCPKTMKNPVLEARMEAICEEWFDKKNNVELSFMLGQLSLDNPLDRRYFVIENSEGLMEAFITCMPYSNQSGYYVDVMRKSHGASLGTMEKLISDAFEYLKEEGVQQLSLGLAPLAGIKAGVGLQSKILTTLFNFIFEHSQTAYGFKPLYQFKKKFDPDWSTRYIAFYPPKFTPNLGFSLVQIKYRESLWKVFWGYLANQLISSFNKTNQAGR